MIRKAATCDDRSPGVTASEKCLLTDLADSGPVFQIVGQGSAKGKGEVDLTDSRIDARTGASNAPRPQKAPPTLNARKEYIFRSGNERAGVG